MYHCGSTEGADLEIVVQGVSWHTESVSVGNVNVVLSFKSAFIEGSLKYTLLLPSDPLAY